MLNLRFFVEKKNNFDLEAKRLGKQFREELSINDLKEVRLINCYDIFNLSGDEDNIKKIEKMVLSEPVTDKITREFDLKNKKYFAIEYLPGQFDQRADSAKQSIDIVTDENKNIEVLTSKIVIFNDDLSLESLEKIKKFYINPIETREKDLSKLEKENTVFNLEVPVYDNFTALTEVELRNMRDELGLSMSFEDFKFIQEHFRKIFRNPTETEIKVLDTYWSDHCRHTTFETKINKVSFPDSEFGRLVEKEFNLEISDENNACSI